MKKLFVAVVLLTLASITFVSAEASEPAGRSEFFGRSHLAQMENADLLLRVYDAAEEALEAYAPYAEIGVTDHKLTSDEKNALDVFFDVDHEYVFWGYVGNYEYSGDSLRVKLGYRCSKEEKEAYDAVVANIISGITPEMTDLDIELYLHNRLAEIASYDYDSYESGKYGPHTRDAYGALVEGLAVCQGYAEAYQGLLHAAGISSILVFGDNHSWNYVRIGGKWYHVDVTWDDNTDGWNNKYFNLTDELISQETKNHKIHPFSAFENPVCDSTDAYYKNIKSIKSVILESTEFFSLRGFAALENVEIPFGVKTVGNQAFEGCTSLTSVTIPDSVTTIGDYAFSGCSSLAGVTIPDSVTTIGDYAFSGCSSLTGVKIPDGVTAIGERAFRDCTALKNAAIGDGVTTLASNVFYNCPAIETVVLGNGLTEIGGYTFSECGKLKSVTIGSSVTAIGDYAFSGCSSLTGVTIPDGVTAIGERAFRGCTSLTSVTIPDSVTAIGDWAFYCCSSLTGVKIPDGVTAIGAASFYGCSSLTSITIPDSVTTIGEWAFPGCTSLNTVYYGGSKEQWEAIEIGSYNSPLQKANIIFAKEESAEKVGDLTGDGKINSRDVIALMKLVLTPGAHVTTANDLNNDGKVNSRDVIALMKLVLTQS